MNQSASIHWASCLSSSSSSNQKIINCGFQTNKIKWAFSLASDALAMFLSNCTNGQPFNDPVSCGTSSYNIVHAFPPALISIRTFGSHPESHNNKKRRIEMWRQNANDVLNDSLPPPDGQWLVYCFPPSFLPSSAIHPQHLDCTQTHSLTKNQISTSCFQEMNLE